MTTVGELIAELQRFSPRARVSVHVDLIAAVMVTASSESCHYEADTIEPVGCNPFDVQITLGDEV